MFPRPTFVIRERLPTGYLHVEQSEPDKSDGGSLGTYQGSFFDWAHPNSFCISHSNSERTTSHCNSARRVKLTSAKGVFPTQEGFSEAPEPPAFVN